MPETAAPRRHVMVFTKVPVPGEVKTRLSPPLSPADAADLARVFLQDTVEKLQEPPSWDLSVHFSPASLEDPLRALLPAGTDCRPQSTGDLGERLLRAFACGATGSPAIALGSDSPDLPLATVHEAFQHLDAGTDLVLGPTRDGGYYLIGLLRPQPELFQAMPWSTELLFEATLQRARELRLSMTLLNPWEDVDNLDDLLRLRERLELAGGTEAPRTWKLLTELICRDTLQL